MSDSPSERAERLLGDCEIGPACAICRTLRDLLAERDRLMAALEAEHAYRIHVEYCRYCGETSADDCGGEAITLRDDANAKTDAALADTEGR
jgi:hypothetical protein